MAFFKTIYTSSYIDDTILFNCFSSHSVHQAPTHLSTDHPSTFTYDLATLYTEEMYTVIYFMLKNFKQ